MLLGAGTYSTEAPLPAGAKEYLTRDNPRLLELARRYSAIDSPLTRHTFWTEHYRTVDLDLSHFRGDNAYVWQQRKLGDLRLKLFITLEYLERLDERQLLTTLVEDGLFGCWTERYDGRPVVSRDLLDSVNEIYFLNRHWDLFGRDGFSILDIGAGYGRLAHRMIAGVPGLATYYCADAIPESTFLAEYYLSFRDVMSKARIVPLDERDALPVGGIDLALNIHSFSEMSAAAIGDWMQELVRLEVPYLLVVPNDAEGLLSVEADGNRQPAEHVILDAGYERIVREPVFLDPSLPELLGVADAFYFYRRRSR